MLLTVDVTNIALSGATQFDIDVETRNSEDTTWTSLGLFAAITAVGVHTKDYTGPKELVRLKCTFSGGTPVPTDAIHLLVQPPFWRPYA